MAARSGVTLILVASNNGTSLIGADTFRFEPSAFSAELGSLVALGPMGERMPPSHAIATAAQITIAGFPQLNSIQHVSSVLQHVSAIYKGQFILARVLGGAVLMNESRLMRPLP